MEIEILLDISDAAEKLGLTESTLRSWVFLKRIETVKLGRRRKIPLSEIHRLIEEGRQPRRKELEFDNNSSQGMFKSLDQEEL